VVNTLLNPAYLARHGLIFDSINILTSFFDLKDTKGKWDGARTHGLERSRNKVIVGEPVVGESEI
jgi:hypothetical protein